VDVADLLAQVPVFSPLSRSQREQLAAILGEQTFDTGEHAVREGEPPDAFYVILEGEARVHSGERTLASLGPGDHFGEIALLQEGGRTATVTAVSSLRCAGLSEGAFRRFVGANAEFRAALREHLPPGHR